MSRAVPIRVVVVDDHDIVRDGLVAVIRSDKDIEVVAGYARGEDFLANIERDNPDLVLLDVRMPEMDGLEILMKVRARRPEQRVLMVSSQEGDQAVIRALKSGAVGYVLKKQPSRQLIEAIHRGVEERVPLSPDLAVRLVQRPKEEMTTREVAVLKLIARGRSNLEIAETLSISHHTVRNHIVSIMAKLEVTDRTQAVTIAIQRGIIDVD